MPRKYRPPAARRRKSKRAAPVYVEPLPEDSGAASQTQDAGVSEIETPEAEPEVEERAFRPSERSDGRGTSTTAARHILRDYSYVRAEVKRIVLVAGFLLVALIITALLRN